MINVFRDRANRHLLWNLVRRNLKLKYKGSALGYIWSLITPLVYLLVFNFVFSNAFADVENYSLYIITGIVFWIFFSNASSETVATLLRNASIIKSIKVPIFVFPLSSLITEVISLMITMVAFSFLLIYLDFEPSLNTFMIIPYTLIFGVFILGFSTMLSALNVYFRDISILWSTILPVLFYFSPIAFSSSLVPSDYHWILKLNPLYFFFDAVHIILYENAMPDAYLWLQISAMAIVSFALGLFTLKKLERGLVSNL